MSYIEREALKEHIGSFTGKFDDDGFWIDLQAVLRAIDFAPTADVAEVVRCKDCVNYCGFEHCKNGICDKDVVSKRAVYPTDYCSYGEKRDA